MLNLSSVTARSRYARALLVVAASIAIFGAAKKSKFTTHEKAYYADPSVIEYVNPGLNITAVSANIATNGTISVDYKLTDPSGAALDQTGVSTPGLVARDLHETLKSATGRATASAASGRFRSAPVASELTLALVLLIGAGLMVRAFWRLQETDAGIDSRNVLTMRVALPSTSYRDATAVSAFWTAWYGRLKTIPGIEGASLPTGLPPSRRLDSNDTQIEGFVPREGGPQQNVDYWNIVTSG